MINQHETDPTIVELNDYFQKLKRQKAREQYRNYKLGFERGRNYQHKTEKKARFWVGVLIGTSGFLAGIWITTLVTNGTWSWS